jgi:hypothetical protein
MGKRSEKPLMEYVGRYTGVGKFIPCPTHSLCSMFFNLSGIRAVSPCIRGTAGSEGQCSIPRKDDTTS